MTFDEAVDRLYGAPLAEFVAERKRLAEELPKEEAQRLRKLRKPNTAAWILNQLARRNRRDVDLLLDAGHRMRRAGARRDAFERAHAKEADALRRLTKASEELGASAQVAAKVNAALRSAAVTEAGREQLALGRFVDLPAASGFDAYAGIPLPKPAKRAPRPEAKPARDDRELRAARAALRDAEQRLRDAERAVAAARADVEAARRRLGEVRR